MKGISIIICCFNSSKRLPQAIHYLAMQKVAPDIPWEVIIVDNGSQDDTPAVAARELARYPWKQAVCKVVGEPKPGLSHAREKGVEEAAYGYVAFCDDDNWLAEEYVQTAYDFLEQHPIYAAVGGCSEAAFDDGVVPPDWFEEYQMGYAVGRQGEPGDITERGYLWGAGIVFRKSLYQFVINRRFPSLLTDRKGNELSSGGDSEICLRFVIVGYKLYYSEQMKFRHFITSNRLTTEYRKKLWDGFLASETVLSKYYYYLKATRSPDRAIQKLKITAKYVLHHLGFRRLTDVDERLLYVLTSFKPIKHDRDYSLIRDLSKIKTVGPHELVSGS